MRLRTVAVVLLIALLALFAALNWPAFAAPDQLDLLFTTVQAPLGLVLLALLGLAVLGFALYMATWQTQMLLDYRRHTKELEQQRALADKAEASRFTDLGELLRAQVAQLEARLEAVQEELRREVRENANSVAASLGEMDDRMKGEGARRLPPP